jgi:Zn-finger nucleic acid-binding protein
VTYRDHNDRCPRCGTPLVQAGAARGCEACRGVWLPVSNVQEMASAMQNPPMPVKISGMVESRQALACPDCTEPMEPISTMQVSLDMCKKGHGIWFDANELGTLLFRMARTGS